MNSSELRTRLGKTLEFLESELTQIRTGRAAPSLLEDLPVQAYGAKMTLKEVGTISVPDSQTLVVSPWDKSLLNEIAKSIRESDLKVSPVVGGDSVKVPLPPLTEERRKEFAKVVSSKVEDAKNSIRNVRQEGMKDIEKLFSDKKIGEDEKFARKEEAEEIVKEYTDKAEELGDRKEKDLMTV